MTDLFNSFSSEFLGVLEHLRGAMYVICAGQLPPALGIRGNALSQFPQIWWVLTPFLLWPNFALKRVSNKILKTDQKSNNEIGVRPLYLSPILHRGYHIRHMARFWYGKTSLKEDFKNTKSYQNIQGQKMVRQLIFYLQKFYQIDS